MTSIKRVATVLKRHWKEDEKLRWASLRTNCLPSPSGHIYLFGPGVAGGESDTLLTMIRYVSCCDMLIA